MYEPSLGFYTTAVQAKTRRLNWHGTLTDTDGTDYAFTAKDIVKDSGTITEAVSGTEITLGTVYASQLEIGLYIDSVGVDRSKIYGGQISLAYPFRKVHLCQF